MELALLKKIRVLVSLIFLLATTALFLDFTYDLPDGISSYVLFPQFIPSILKFMTVFSLSAAGFILILIITLLFGRVYCSSICPLGTLQDIISRISRKVKIAKRYRFLPPLNLIRYTILGLTIIIFLFGFNILLNLLDPFSSYGKIINGMVRPAAIGLNNTAASLFELFNLYFIYPVEFKGIEIGLLIMPAALFIIIALLSGSKGRLYCNSICPVGALLALASKISLYKIVIDEDFCAACGDCETACKSGCIDSDNKYIDFTRCVSCFNCFDICQTNGLRYENRLIRHEEKESGFIDFSKREFLTNSFLYALGFTSLSYSQDKIDVYKENKIPVIRKDPITPPGSKGIDHLTGLCTACHLCVSACPTQVLQPSFLEYGFLGMLQPRMDNKKGFCNYECTICGEVCPTGAILPMKSESKKLIQIGKVNFIKENCVVQTQGTDCGACAEHCPTKAVRMEYYRHPDHPYKDLKIPVTDNEICVGCGACEYACPTIPFKAIYVQSNAMHLTAKKPEVEKLEQPDLEEFPF